ncbi:MAG: NAD-dependent epimerase/dehydratase family protein [Deltaproteobacteria bacterium]|nr:NAD-dependent epimerase/dehydratase family protein [Deltaproteobacteria bacterium]
MMSSPLVLITGATGAIGPRVVAELCRAGYAVRALSIDQPQHGSFPGGVEVRTGDITDPATVRSAVNGVQAVVHMAALLHNLHCPPELYEKYERINVGGTAHVVKAASLAHVERVVLFSTIAVYGASNGSVLTEKSHANPDTVYAKTKLAAEQFVLNARRRDGQPLGTVLRLGAVYGPGLKGNYHRLLLALARGKFIPIGDGRNRRTLIYDRDVARATVLALQHPLAAGRIYNVSDGRFHAISDIIQAMSLALGRNPPAFSLPAAPIRLAAGLLEDTARLFGRRLPVGRETIDKYTEDIAVSSERIQAELQFKPCYDLMAGWAETVEELKLRS